MGRRLIRSCGQFGVTMSRSQIAEALAPVVVFLAFTVATVIHCRRNRQQLDREIREFETWKQARR